MVNTLVNVLFLERNYGKLWKISFHLVSVLFLGLFGLRIRLIWPPYQADMAPYQANTHRYQAVPWRRETTLILTLQSYNIFRATPNFGIV